MRWAGIDYGKRRIGVAISDPGETIASPTTTLDGAGSAAADARCVAEWACANEVEALVVGLPLNMDGTVGPQAQETQRFVEQLRTLGQLPVEEWDERLSSYQADEYMQSAGLSRDRQKRMRDALAAQVILQSFLDARNNS